MNYRVLNDKLLVKRDAPVDQNPGGVIQIPDEAKDKPMHGTVVAKGPGTLLDDASREPIDVQIAERVLIGKFAGTEILIKGVPHVIVREEEILAVCL